MPVYPPRLQADDDGPAFLIGDAAPSAAAGQTGDLYLDQAGPRLYGPKAAGVWGSARTLGLSVNDWSKATATVRENFPRLGSMANLAGHLTSGRLHLYGMWYEAGDVVTSVSFWSGTTALVTGSNQWAALFDGSRVKLAVSADDTSGAWSASTEKTFTLTAPYTIPTSGVYYHGLCVVASTMPSMTGFATLATLNAKAPAMSGYADASLTNPASCPATAAALTGTAGVAYTTSQ